MKLAASTTNGASWSTSTAANVSARSPFFPAVATSGSGSSVNVLVGFAAVDDKPAGTPPGAGVVSDDAYYALKQGAGAFGASVKISASSSDPDRSSAMVNASADSVEAVRRVVGEPVSQRPALTG